MNNHLDNQQNTTFHQLWHFIKTCRSPAGAGFNKKPQFAEICHFANLCKGLYLFCAQWIRLLL
ncbi:hypothetical protein SPBRAN_897 [uncultured Candidatus Thioglobus sp.]|nr:hypothetical protein SPBRAN_897 [uncultured Candidatus Thioglobus sp.]